MDSENKIKVVGITKNMELHIHGNTGKQKWYTNLSIVEILDILEEYTYKMGDNLESEMSEHLAQYFYEKQEN